MCSSLSLSRVRCHTRGQRLQHRGGAHLHRQVPAVPPLHRRLGGLPVPALPDCPVAGSLTRATPPVAVTTGEHRLGPVFVPLGWTETGSQNPQLCSLWAECPEEQTQSVVPPRWSSGLNLLRTPKTTRLNVHAASSCLFSRPELPWPSF